MTLEKKIEKNGSHTFKVDGQPHVIVATDKGYSYRGTTFRQRAGVWYVRRKGKKEEGGEVSGRPGGILSPDFGWNI